MDYPSDVRVKELDAVFAEMSAATYRALWDELPELTTREKILLSLVADVCEQTLGVPFEEHVTAALEHGVPVGDLRELVRFIAYDSGYPAARSALERLAGIERARGLDGAREEGHEVNADGAGTPLPAPMVRAVRGLDEPFAEYMALQSRMRGGMTRIGVRERAFATMTVDVLYQTLDESFRAHVTRALGAGATPEELRAVVRFSALFGLTRAWRALRVLDALLTETGSVYA